jgi:preprotein translocase subunit SecA
LHIIGTERHESRRIDRQLRGRSARQGDPGSSRFFLSLEDDLLRIFGADRISGIMNRFGMEEGEPIEHKLITRAIENAQRRVENRNFEVRKHLLQYDDVMNKQREIIYAMRNRALHDETLEDLIQEDIHEIAPELCDEYFAEGISPEEIDIKGFKESVFKHFATPLWNSPDELIKAKPEELEQIVFDAINKVYRTREQQFGPETMRQIEKWIFLRVQDELWKDHLLDMDHLREGIGLRGYAQQDPLREYQREAYDLFLKLDSRMKIDFIEKLFTVQIMPREEMRNQEQQKNIVLSRGKDPEQQEKKPLKRQQPKVGRNDPCPCGSGKKFKKCCG